MPELPITVNANITRIDAPFPEQWREELFQFTKGLDEIKELMALIATSLTESKDAQQEIAKLYTKESVAERASQAVVEQQPHQHRPKNEQGEEEGTSRPEPAPEPHWEPHRERQERERENPSRPPDREEDYILDQPIQMPQHFGGKYTAEDLLKLMGKGSRWLGEQTGVEGFTNASEGFAKGAEWQPTVSAIGNLGRTYYSSAKNWSEGLGQYSGSLGYEPGNGALGANNVSGPFGTNFRLPIFNSAALSGITQKAEAYGTALTVPGLSGSQAMAMSQSLAERGWFPGQKGQQELFDAQAHLIGRGGVFEQLGTNPEVSELMDRGMRSGQAGMDEMLRTIEEIPEAAKHAHESVDQMIQSLDEMGAFAQSQGGTHFAGQQQALGLANTTGIPVQATKGLVESPWATSAIFRQTGMPSWMQGTVPGGVKNDAIMNSFWQLSKSVGKGEGHTYKSGGFEQYVSPIEEQAARMHMLLPDMNPEAITRMLREGQQGTKGRGEIQKQAEMWKKNAQQFMGSGDEALENQLLTGTTVGKQNFGRLLHNMGQMKTDDGRRMFSKDDLKDIRTNFGEGYDTHGQRLVEDKYKSVQEILGAKAGKDSNAAGSPGNVMIELSPAAKKLLQLPNKQSRIKLEAGAGENSTVNGFSGSTDPLSPVPQAGYHPVPDNAGGFDYIPNE